jgi:type IX secretion system PorP/SprF family membrane protein
MFRPFIIVALLFFAWNADAQEDPNFSQYMNNNLVINPGYAGSRDLVCISGVSRLGMVGFKGAPKTNVFSINAPIKILKGGIGLNITNETFAYDKNLSLHGIYSYTFDLEQGKIGLGTNLGFINKGLDVKDGWIGSNGSTDITSDGSIPKTKENTMAFDMGLGVYYRTDLLFFGLSAMHLTSPKYDNDKARISRHFYLTAGYILSMTNPLFEFQPSVMIGSTGGSNVYDLNGLLIYNKRIWGGISYRLSSAIVGMFGLELKNGLRIGYSYDFNTTDLMKYNSGTHELTLGYSFSLEKEKIPHKYKSVRFL